MEEALSARSSRAPHVVRMLPVQASCSVHTRNIVQAVAPLLQAALPGSEASFAVQWRRRHNTTLDKMEVINAVAGAVQEVAPKACVELSSPEAAVSIEVIKSVCCIGVLTHWQKYKEYNLRATAGLTSAAAAAAAAAPGRAREVALVASAVRHKQVPRIQTAIKEEHDDGLVRASK